MSRHPKSEKRRLKRRHWSRSWTNGQFVDERQICISQKWTHGRCKTVALRSSNATISRKAKMKLQPKIAAAKSTNSFRIHLHVYANSLGPGRVIGRIIPQRVVHSAFGVVQTIESHSFSDDLSHWADVRNSSATGHTTRPVTSAHHSRRPVSSFWPQFSFNHVDGHTLSTTWFPFSRKIQTNGANLGNGTSGTGRRVG